MDKELLDYAYAGLLHDIGKFYQRTETKSSLNLEELDVTPMNEKIGYHTHLHSGYTYRFFTEELGLKDALERAASSHHISSSEDMDAIIRRADIIASKVDRNDENSDDDSNHKKNRYSYITSRLDSILSEVDFGKDRERAAFPLSSLDEVTEPVVGLPVKNREESAEEYYHLFRRFLKELRECDLRGGANPYSFNKMYSLLFKYTSFIPSSTYESSRCSVSLFDHLKLTSAIASCLYYSKIPEFYMLEFDISGIQKFIYKITESNETKKGIAKALRGRSAYVGLLTNSITYCILKEFGLTQANIIYNTGGGANILLPCLEDIEERINNLMKKISSSLFDKFNTDLTFVYALEKMNDQELTVYKTEKALTLKRKLEEAKQKKHLSMMSEKMGFKKIDSACLCKMCQSNVAKQNYCQTCEDIIKISDFYIKHNSFNVLYVFDDGAYDIDLGFVKIRFITDVPGSFRTIPEFYYMDNINCFDGGNVKQIANLVPKMNGESLNFESIAQSLGERYGDSKLAILKMDVDNLGAIFAFGLKQNLDGDPTLQRSLSKYLTMSRLIELFFSKILKEICVEVSKELQEDLENVFYINYAGGDDLVIIGPVYGIVSLSQRIHQRFISFVNNKNISLSGGIFIQSSKKPIRFGIQQADEELELSKSYQKNGNIEKNAVSIMNTTISFDEWDDILAKVEKYREWLTKKSVSRSCLYDIMTYMNVKDMEDFYVLVPKIHYSLIRNLEKKTLIRKEIIQDINDLKDIESIQKFVLILKLCLLFTRGN